MNRPINPSKLSHTNIDEESKKSLIKLVQKDNQPNKSDNIKTIDNIIIKETIDLNEIPNIEKVQPISQDLQTIQDLQTRQDLQTIQDLQTRQDLQSRKDLQTIQDLQTRQDLQTKEEQPVIQDIDYIKIVKEMSLEDIFINLNLISKIDVGDKLCINDKYINIDTSYLPSVTRWFFKVDRKITLNFVNLIINKSFELCDDLNKNDKKDDAKLLFRLTTDLRNSITGLTNIKQTYLMDKLVQAEIDVIVENIRNKIDSIFKS